MSTRENARKAAILIVNGGDNLKSNRWIKLCLNKIAAHTQYPNYHLYVWNNRIEDQALEAWLLGQPRLTLISAACYEDLHHPHRTPLQRLYHLARQEGATYIVSLDSDAHPLRSGWLTELITRLDEGAVLSGNWRDEMVPAIRPHVHASCLCTTVDFIETHQLRFDFDTTHSAERSDTLSHFSWVAEANSLPIHRLFRSNQRRFHYWMGGIYGDLIYHHAAASRKRILFHNTPIKDQFQIDVYQKLRDETGELLFSAYDVYMDWLRGKEVSPRFQRDMERLCALADSKRSLRWWLARALSPEFQQTVLKKIRTGAAAKAPSSPLASRIKNKTDRAVSRVLDVVHVGEKKREPTASNAMHTSFGRAHCYPVPAHGWTTQAPDFIGIGSPKSGTTLFHYLLLQHPQIVYPRIQFTNRKETQYFLHFQHRDLPDDAIDTYCQAFASPPGAICGEFSSQYLTYPNCLEHLAVAAPNSKILLILRNPIDRFISHLNHLIIRRGRYSYGEVNDAQRYLLHTFSFYTEAVLHSLYSIGLARLFQYFTRDQILILQYERLIREPREQMVLAYEFLGVDARFRARDYQKQVNTGIYAIPKPEPTERQRLAAYFAEDVKRTFALCQDIDPKLWSDFTHLV
jgi:hypothetical protein